MIDPILLISAIIYHLIFLSVFSYLYFVEQKKYILFWTLSWFSFLLSSMMIQLIFVTEYGHFFMALEKTFSLLGVWFIAQGSLVFFRNKASKVINVISIVFILFYFTAYIMNLPEHFFHSPNAIITGLLLIYVGILSIRTVYVNSRIRYLLGGVFTTWGIGCLLFLTGYFYGEAIFDIAYALVGLSAITSSICLMLAYFLHTREHQATLDEKIRYINMYDPLTDVYNRAYFELLLEKFDVEDQLPVSIILGDLNNLKLINDIFGHQTGDDMIIKTAEMMKSSTKDSLVARWGGDEFMILLPQTGYEQGKNIVHTIKKAAVQYKTDYFPLDISLGLATKEMTNQSLTSTIKLADNALYKNKFKESSQAKKSLVEFFKKMLFEKDVETKEHVFRVEELALIIADQMDLTKREKEELSLVAFFHDIGKISIPKNILTKPGKLTTEEWLTMKRHSEIGYRILISSNEFVHISQAVLSHHEAWNGRGYPQNLAGEDIPLTARIIAIADAYDAMVHFSVYKDSRSHKEALEEIQRCSGTQFDPHIANIFVTAMRESPAIDAKYQNISGYSMK